MKAKVFISCCQAHGSEEERIAKKIGYKLKELGYEYYIAIQEQTLDGIKENVFRQLETSEYYLFIDFRREELKLNSSPKPVFRGSLFTHQELAIASYLEIPVLAFQEKGVKLDDGLLGFIQGNSFEFEERSTLPEMIVDKLKERRWRNNWKNALSFSSVDPQYDDTPGIDGEMKRFFHLGVKNKHMLKLALNCFVYLQRITDLKSGDNIPVRWVELKWAGYTMPNAAIAPGTIREFDAGKVRHTAPGRWLFSAHTDSPRFWTTIDGPGLFEVVYVVHSDAFGTEKSAFRLTLSDRLEELRLEPAS